MYVGPYVFGCLTGVASTVLSEIFILLAWCRNVKKKEYEKEKRKNKEGGDKQ